jgi:RNA polymerase sigma-70 factor (ECF subfamily)
VNDDAALIDQTLAGQTAAFGHLVERYQDRLYNTVLHAAGNAEDAKDVVQEAFVQAFLKLDTFQHASAFYTWLYRIAFNVAATHRRRRHATFSIDRGQAGDGREPVDVHEGPTARLDRDERCRQVRQAIGELSDEHRAILVLREIEGFTYETIAEILDLPVGTVRSRLHRARLQLRGELKELLIIED